MDIKTWFFSLPVWEEADNYIYFGLAGALLYFLPLDETSKATIGGALIGALIMKGRGSVRQTEKANIVVNKPIEPKPEINI